MGVRLTDTLTAIAELSKVDHASHRMAVNAHPPWRTYAIWFHSACALQSYLHETDTTSVRTLREGTPLLVGAPRKQSQCYHCGKLVHRLRKKRHA